MRGIVFKAFLIFCAVSAYIGAPFYTAWSIREAVRNGNSHYLAAAIDWPSVRETLKPSLAELISDVPGITAASQSVERPGVWQRVKNYFAEGAMHRAVDGYLTPEGLPQLFQMRKAYRDYISGEPDENKRPIGERIQRAWSRVKRAEFTSPTSFEVDMQDKFNESRMFLGKLELTPFGWQLKELRVKMLTTASNTIQQFASVPSPAFRHLSNGFVTRAEAAEWVPPARRQSWWARAKDAAKTKWRGAD